MDLDRMLGQIERGRLADTTKSFLDEMLAQLESEIDKRVYQVLRDNGSIPAEVAIQAWIEKHTYSRLRTRVSQIANSGETAGRLVEPAMKLRTGIQTLMGAASTPSSENGGYDGENS